MHEQNVTFFFYVLIFFNSCQCKIPFLFKINYCQTLECKHLGYSINSYINQSIDPCVNFYKFSCNNWALKIEKPDYEPIWSNWQILASQINDRIEEILKFENESLKKVKKFYDACLNSHDMEYKYLNNLRLLIKDFRGWPLVQNVNLKNYNWFKDILKITRLLGVYPIFKISVNIDYKNTSTYALYIEPGDLIYPTYILREPKKYQKELKSYKFWILQSIKLLYKTKIKRNIKQEITKIIQFESKLALLNERSKNERFTLIELSKKFNYDWEQAFKILNIKIDKNQKLIIKNYSYFINVFNLLQQTDAAIIANYLMWYTVKDLSRETGNKMSTLNFMVDNLILGVKTDIHKKTECLNKIQHYFQNAIVPIYFEKYSNPIILNIVEEMVRNIKNEFIKLIKKSNWLNERIKYEAIDKIKYLKEFIGYPKSMRQIDAYYKNVNITNNHFHNMLNMKNSLIEKQFEKYNTTVDEIIWPSGALEVNAYYSILQNAIFIPLGILQAPFFDLNLPDALNYGALGSLIGHEISHALDMNGRQANKYGNIVEWWDYEDVFKYKKRSECYENSYNSLDINGRLTIGENIADNVGIEISFSAFKQLKRSKMFNIVPYLETFSTEQLFYLAYTQMWCEKSEKTQVFINDEHAPVESRVLGTLNNENFHKYFHCDLVNKEYCKLW